MKIKAIPFSRSSLAIGCILIVGALLRLHGITFGLPSLYDPDEPIFLLSGVKLLRDGTLNPGWFGHPGSTTIYTLGFIDALVFLIGHLTGQFPDARAFGTAIYADPTVVVLPGRLFIVLCGLACVFLIFIIGRRLFDTRTGLMAAALLAVNPLHIEWSQIIRTDVHATVFMLLCVLCSIDIVRRGRFRDYLLAGVAVGFACATKWPSATIIVCPIGACLLRAIEHPEESGTMIKNIATIILSSAISLVAASPYLVLDYQTVLVNVIGEGQPFHLGATGSGFFPNMWWYLSNPIYASIGIFGIAFAIIGAAVMAARNRTALVIVMPSLVIFFVVLCTQALIWTRWIVPLLPFVSLLIAVGISGAWKAMETRLPGKSPVFLSALILCGVVGPMLLTAQSQATERLHDTRSLASIWARQHIPEGSSIVLEHIALDLLDDHRRLLFPAGDAGCVDAMKAVRGRIRNSEVNKVRGGRTVVDLGTVNDSKLDGCRADFAILSHYDRYLAEPQRYGHEIAVYKKLSENGTLLKVFSPEPGKTGGPVVRILGFKRQTK